MLKRSLFRGAVSFSCALAAAQLVTLFTMLLSHGSRLPLVPELAGRFSSDGIALGVQNVCAGIIGLAFGACSIIFDIEKWSFVKQGIVHFIITSAVWVGISVFCWGLGKYTATLISTFINFAVTYFLIWFLNYRRYKKNIEEINERLRQLNAEAEEKE